MKLTDDDRAEWAEVLRANRRAADAYYAEPTTVQRPSCRDCSRRTRHPSGFCVFHRPGQHRQPGKSTLSDI